MKRKHILDTVLRIAVHVGGIAPLLVLARAYAVKALTVNPIQAAEQRTGDIALVLLLLTLACTPLSLLTGYAPLKQRTRALGLYTFFYASVHLFLFTVVDYGLDLGLLFQQLTEKPYIIAGTATFLILLALAITSFRWWMKRMGKRWKQLHRLVYLAGVLAALHLAWALKGDLFHLTGDVGRPLLVVAILLILFGLRLPPVRRWIGRLRRTILSRSLPSGRGKEISGVFTDVRRQKPLKKAHIPPDSGRQGAGDERDIKV